jgi:hypothetical protein
MGGASGTGGVSGGTPGAISGGKRIGGISLGGSWGWGGTGILGSVGSSGSGGIPGCVGLSFFLFIGG